MSVPFVDREPEKQEIERLRHLLCRYESPHITSLFNPGRSRKIRELIAEAFQISSDVSSPTNSLINRAFKYKIEITETTPHLFSENGDVAVKKKNHSFAFYWDYLSKFNITMENYRENPAAVGIASVDLLYQSDSQLDLFKSSFLDLAIGEGGGRLSQYSYYVDPQKLRWYFHEVSSDLGSFDFLYGADIDMVFRIGINRNDILRHFNEIKEPNKSRKRKRGYYPTIRIEYFLSQHRRVWRSDIFQVESLSASQIIGFHTIATAREQKEAALAQLEEYIRTDPEEKEFQKLLTQHQWILGHEYSEFSDKRELVIDSQQDFVVRRATDGFWDFIEIKRPLNGKSLFKPDASHNTLYPGVDLSKAIGQVIHYIDRIDSGHYGILNDRRIDTNKVRAKLIIGRDGDSNQVNALHNLNSHLNRIEILTYDQLLRVARRSIPDY